MKRFLSISPIVALLVITVGVALKSNDVIGPGIDIVTSGGFES
ncbi:hypothetical protein [Alicyclobacillus dauci]|uniref:Uncharacterized protein n=1 Tax=Alicyclobacillus dauci TaxID=1475485 RepID=A0ABY6Z4E8_9BACL|nr:hypothetical protein [Alicyclobacillus dauci]WAH37763.1 hypothetical protein NZD86_04470 [Alicyclobacillus dauci]